MWNPLIPGLDSSFMSATGDSGASKCHLLCWCAGCTPVCVFVPLELCHPSSLHKHCLSQTQTWCSWGRKQYLGARFGPVCVSRTRRRIVLICGCRVQLVCFTCIAVVLRCCCTVGDSEEVAEIPTKCCTKSTGSWSPWPLREHWCLFREDPLYEDV